MYITTNNLRKSRFFKIAPILNLGIIGNGSYLAGGALRTLINPNEEAADFDIFFEDDGLRNPLPEIPEQDDPFNIIQNEQIDFNHPARVQEVRDILIAEKFKLVFQCEKGELFTYKKGDVKIQLITVKFLDMREMISTFDFGACQAAFNGECVVFSTAFVRNVCHKKLSTEFVEYPAATINRMIKYSKKGYYVGDAIVQFMQQISGLTFDGEKLQLYID